MFYCVAALLFVEAALRLGLSNPTLLWRIRQERDAWYRLWWVQRHRPDTPIYYRFDVYHPTRGWAIKPDVHNMHVFDHKMLNTNARGLRGATDYGYDKPSGHRRIVVLGDSWTFGDEVSDDEAYAVQLRDTLSDTEVLNFGVHGYGHDQELLYLCEEALRYHPDVVIVAFIDIDVYRNLLSFRDFAKPKYLLDGTRLVLTNVPVPLPEDVLRRERARLKLLDATSLLYQGLRWATGDWRREAERMTTAILTELARTVEEAGAVPLFVNLDPGAHEAFFVSLCRHINATLRPPDTLRCLTARTPQGEGMRINSHPSPAAHRLIALALRDYLVQNGLATSGQ